MLELARIIAGEAPGCPIDAKIAVAKVVYNRRNQGVVEQWSDGWFGNRDPQQIDFAVAVLHSAFPDPSRGAVYLIGPGDKEKMPWLHNSHPTARWKCNGTVLEAYRG